MSYLSVLGSNFEKPLSYLKSAHSNLPCCKVSCKKKKLFVRFLYVGAGIWKYCCHIWNQRPRICLAAKFGAKITILRLPEFGYFWSESWNIYCHIWNQHPRLCLIAKFCEKKKIPKFGTKNPLFEYFWVGIWKWYCDTWNPHPQIWLIAKFCEKPKTPKFGIKNDFLGIFGLEFQKTIVIFEINSLKFA